MKCKECGQSLVEIDNRGQHLRGCLTCNEWRDGEGNLVKLPVEDLAIIGLWPWAVIRLPQMAANALVAQ